MGICRILLSPCGLGLLSEKCFAAGFILARISLGSLRSAISPPASRMRWRGQAPGGVKIESCRTPGAELEQQDCSPAFCGQRRNWAYRIDGPHSQRQVSFEGGGL